MSDDGEENTLQSTQNNLSRFVHYMSDGEEENTLQRTQINLNRFI